jgi:hypothetical protein
VRAVFITCVDGGGGQTLPGKRQKLSEHQVPGRDGISTQPEGGIGDLITGCGAGRQEPVFDAERGTAFIDPVAGPIPVPEGAVVQAQGRQTGYLACRQHGEGVFVQFLPQALAEQQRRIHRRRQNRGRASLRGIEKAMEAVG